MHISNQTLNIALSNHPRSNGVEGEGEKTLYMKEIVTARSYTLHDAGGQWLGQVVLTSDGMFAGVTDYGNLSFAWRNTGDGDIRKFIIGLNTGYFGGKLYQGMAYILYGRKCEKACDRFAEKILPVLITVLEQDLIDSPVF